VTCGAKQTLKASGIPFRMPACQEFEARLRSVLHVLYLLFNEGYTSSAGADLHRPDLSGEAIRLTRAMHAMLPERGEVTGLLALMLLNDARRPAHTGTHGELIPLADQDRTRWNRPAIAEGVRLAATAMSVCKAPDDRLVPVTTTSGSWGVRRRMSVQSGSRAAMSRSRSSRWRSQQRCSLI
jgi:predicted RNA polymerase sigma factor